jgi:D-alanyl-D-alanine carboxypeptidase
VALAGNKRTIFFVLPQGNPFTSSDLWSDLDREISLHFAEELEVMWRAEIDGVLWYRCFNGTDFFYLPEMLVIVYPDKVKLDSNGDIQIGTAEVDRDNPIPLDYRPNDLVPVLTRYKAEGYEAREMHLRREAMNVFGRLIDHAERDGVHIRILSAFRDAEYQANLYARAIRRNGLFQNSVAKPGHSEHQLGTACDLTTNEIQSGLSKSFENTAAYQWLKDHISDYGLALTYPKYKVEVTGYIYEPWHYRYMGRDRWLALDRVQQTFYSR